jgi:hypothetical protein
MGQSSFGWIGSPKCLEALISSMRPSSIRGCGGSTPIRREGLQHLAQAVLRTKPNFHDGRLLRSITSFSWSNEQCRIWCTRKSILVALVGRQLLLAAETEPASSFLRFATIQGIERKQDLTGSKRLLNGRPSIVSPWRCEGARRSSTELPRLRCSLRKEPPHYLGVALDCQQ